MSFNHIEGSDERYGRIPVCGRADWDELVAPDSPDNECWECASYHMETQPKFNPKENEQ